MTGLLNQSDSEVNDLWVEKYRPKTLEDYVWIDNALRNKTEEWVRDGKTPHLLFVGEAGTGKTSLALLLLHLMNIEKYDILMINGSEKTGINTVVRDSIMNFALSVPVGKIKYIVIDEFEYLSHNAQASLRNIMEGSQDRTRFILTANKTHKILPAIKSRCQTFVFKSLDRELYDARVIDILIREGVDIGSCGEEIVTHVDKCYPDMRKTLNSLQQHFVDGKILGLREAQNNDEYAKVLQDCRSQATFKQAREHVSKNFNENDYVDFYKFLYKNSGEFDDEMSAIIIIAEGLKNHAIAADPEINLMGTMAKLLRNA